MGKIDTANAVRVQDSNNIANVLLVDDDSQFIRNVLEILAQRGIRGNLASNKKDISNFLEKNDFGNEMRAILMIPIASRMIPMRGCFNLNLFL